MAVQEDRNLGGIWPCPRAAGSQGAWVPTDARPKGEALGLCQNARPGARWSPCLGLSSPRGLMEGTAESLTARGGPGPTQGMARALNAEPVVRIHREAKWGHCGFRHRGGERSADATEREPTGGREAREEAPAWAAVGT